ncbi:energy transducer TonB [Salinimicrobium sp. TIG7-5_MAKvit]|uniref:energy transducer TonB n=1 Tax=Salinimicrobium sp. TIG7-5_MAKvit TaxID=3121289 RepID=UPI003C6E0104
MKNKKSAKADLSKRSILFFQLGLVLALFLAWQLIEWQVSSAPVSQQDLVVAYAFEEEPVPVTQVEDVKPPELPKEITEEVEIIKDDVEKEETLIAPTEIPEKILKVAEVEYVDEEEKIEEYNIHAVEEVPVFPGCENLKNNDARKQCFGEQVNRLVGRTFDKALGEKLGLSGLHRIYVSFKVEKDGTVKAIGARGPHPKLEEEAIRVINAFPELIPGKQGGQPVGVIYSLPIVFRIQE